MTIELETPEILEPVKRLSRDMAKAAITLTPDEVRFLVDTYYVQQEARKRADNQVRALAETQEPHDVLKYVAVQSSTLEKQVLRALNQFTIAHPVGIWLHSVKGIGPVISAGLLAHIDITRAPTVGHIWRFAGLDPTSKWEKGCKRPWNASLKRLCWIIGESFVKVSGSEDAYYGIAYAKRKVWELEQNEKLAYKDQAAAVLKAHPDHKQRAIYATGKLSPGHIHARAKRWATKLFIAHLHDKMYREHYKTAPPAPYPIAILQHAHYLAPPE